MESPRGRLSRKTPFIAVCGIGAGLFLAISWDGPSTRPHGERKAHWSGLSFARETDVQVSPHQAAHNTGWDSERVWSGHDDWEPFVAADPSSPYVYQTTTRFSAKISGIFIRVSADRGATWGPDRLVAPVVQWQADPQVQVAGDGTVFVVWLDGPDWKSKLIKSADHGATWSTPVTVAPARPWTDHPWLIVSPDARDIYVGLNTDDSYLVASHDGGQTFGPPVRTSRTPNHWWCHNGGAIGPDGTVYFVAINFLLDYRGIAEINVIRSSDGGASWQVALVDVSAPPPGCGRALGCDYGFLSSTAGLAIDRAGNLLVAYNASDTEGAPQKLWAKTSRDGVNWSERRQVSQPNDAASNGFPAVAAGPASGDFRVVWQGNADGNLRGWNTYYRRTTDCGKVWSETIQLSDRSSGAPYKSRDGFFFPYGDYLSLSVDGEGRNYVIWGEGASYDGPGGVWYTRGRSDAAP